MQYDLIYPDDESKMRETPCVVTARTLVRRKWSDSVLVETKELFIDFILQP